MSSCTAPASKSSAMHMASSTTKTPQSVSESCRFRREKVCSQCRERRGSRGDSQFRTWARSLGRSTLRESSTCILPLSKSTTSKNQCSSVRLIGMIQRRADVAPPGRGHRCALSFQRV
eukprot:419916-Rhodomonas_salina.1